MTCRQDIAPIRLRPRWLAPYCYRLRTGTLLPFGLTWLASYCMTNTNTNTEAGILLLSYRPARTALRTDKTSRRYACETTPITRRADTPTTLSLASYCYLPEPTSLVPICLRDDPVACIVLLPRPVDKPRADTPTSRTRLGRASLPRPPNPSLASYCCLNRQASCRYAYEATCRWHRTATI
ncbi:uncharacterized protein K441DRAFT_136445 [Cenococcum geophilum 1.58]|uniref:uncharacterized protein n=1 Tax=Cenococcum geophilum 1.58 TaxID=794803 RepID=UPI00358EBC12|nr:hypothetical protein K441DRAFT_136445 [Cenococcum geophilum 1.58]